MSIRIVTSSGFADYVTVDIFHANWQSRFGFVFFFFLLFFFYSSPIIFSRYLTKRRELIDDNIKYVKRLYLKW